MNKTPTSKVPKSTKPEKSLSQVLEKNEQVKVMVKESATELASVNTLLSKKREDKERVPEIDNALEKSEAVEAKVQEASEKLATVNKALKVEVKERHLLELQLASVLEQQEVTAHTALHDPLTGLPNRALFNDRLTHGLAQAKRHDRALAVMFMDLDQFKAINDTHGHGAGDIVLKTTAERLKENTRVDDTVSRYGGDEFLYLLLEMTGDEDAIVIAKKIIKALQAPCDIGSCNVSITPSIGIAIFPKDGKTGNALIKSADRAMYQAKKSKSGYAFARDTAVSKK